MAKARALRKRLDDLIDQLEPVLKKAFLESVDDLKSNVSLTKVIEALERNDINGAINAMNLDRAAFAPVSNTLAQAYYAGGVTTATAIAPMFERGAAVIVRFDVRNLRAERWLREKSTDLVTNILEDQRSALRAAIEAGYAKGQHPRTIALDVVGRVNQATGKREGGIIGLSSNQQRYVKTARDELEAGDTLSLRNYLNRERRDKRFDAQVLRAIKTGEPISADTVSKAVARYEARLLELRGEMVARTETMTAVHSSKHEAFKQGLDATGYTTDAVTRTWRSAGDGRVRHTHARMDGQQVQGVDTPFRSPSGALLKHPGDTSLGAGPAEVIGCRCDDEIDIDFSQGLT